MLHGTIWLKWLHFSLFVSISFKINFFVKIYMHLYRTQKLSIARIGHAPFVPYINELLVLNINWGHMNISYLLRWLFTFNCNQAFADILYYRDCCAIMSTCRYHALLQLMAEFVSKYFHFLYNNVNNIYNS